MSKVQYTVKLDLTDNGFFDTGWRIKQGDSGNSEIIALVTNNGVNVFDTNIIPEIVFKRPDGKSIISNMTIKGSNYNYVFVGNELAVPGIVIMDIKITDSEGRVSTNSVKFECVEDTLGYDPEGSKTYDNPVSELVEEIMESSSDSEAWARGTREGVPVSEDDETYNNNAKYYAEHSGGGGASSLSELSDVTLDDAEVCDLLAIVPSVGGTRWGNLTIDSPQIRDGIVMHPEDLNHIIKRLARGINESQEILTAGDGITIENNVISATGGGNADGKIDKYYKSNALTEALTDSEEGIIKNIILYGKSEQGENPSPSNPQTIHSVVEPSLVVNNKNLINLYNVTIIARNGNANIQNANSVKLQQSSSASNVLTIAMPCKKNTVYNFDAKMSAEVYSFGMGCVNTMPTSFVNFANKIKTINSGDNVFLIVSFQLNSGTSYAQIDELIITENQNTKPYEPYIEPQSATLNGITLNAIPTESGGNVTIDGQSYIADYVDIEKKQIVRNISTHTISSSDSFSDALISNKCIIISISDRAKTQNVASETLITSYVSTSGNQGDLTVRGATDSNNLIIKNASLNTFDEFKNFAIGTKIYYQLDTPTIESLTDEQIADFLALRTYNGTTIVTLTSNDINGASQFDYAYSLPIKVEDLQKQIDDVVEKFNEEPTQVFKGSISSGSAFLTQDISNFKFIGFVGQSASDNYIFHFTPLNIMKNFLGSRGYGIVFYTNNYVFCKYVNGTTLSFNGASGGDGYKVTEIYVW